MITLMPNFKKNGAALNSDRVIELANVLKRAAVPFELLFIDPAPNLLVQLREVNFYEHKWTSIFDEIQDVRRRDGIPLTQEDFATPADTDPLFSWPTISWFRDGKREFQLRMANRGYITNARRLTKDGGYVEDGFDYRGFKSTTKILDENNKQTLFIWYSDTGEPVMTEQDGIITIAPAHRERFNSERYGSIDAIIAEFVQKYFDEREDPRLIASYDEDSLHLRNEVTGIAQTDLLMRQDERPEILVKDQPNSNEYYVFPTQKDADFFAQRIDASERQLRKQVTEHTYIIPPYATTLDIGHSNEFEQSTIYWYAVSTDDDQVKSLLDQLIKRLIEDPEKALFAEVKKDLVEELEEFVQERLEEHYEFDFEEEDFQAILKLTIAANGGKRFFMGKADRAKLRENPLYETMYEAAETMVRINFVPEQSRQEQDEEMGIARIYLDTGLLPNLRLQTAAVSSAIPMVVMSGNNLVIDGKTGRVIEDLDAIPDALGYYLDSLRPWNQASVETVALMENYTETFIENSWKELLTIG